MYPYQLDNQPVADAAAEPTTPAPMPARKRRTGTVVLLGLALTAGSIGGGAAGAIGATRWLAQEPALTAAVVAAQPVSLPAVPSANIAGTVFGKVNPAVVQVQALGQTPLGQEAFGSGSGFVIDARGLIFTNNHVVEDARAISVRFSSGEQREARVLGTDRGNDLALLKVDLPPGVPVVLLGDSEQVQVGETAIAIGSPFGLDQSVTQGIISAVDRDWSPGNGRTRRNLIQTDAPINPGNSGGPLLNAGGEVIGINTMIESPVRGSVGVGFAVPINTAKQLLPQLEAGAQLEPVWLGISGEQLDATITKDQALPVTAGVLVTSVVPGSPADQAGLRPGRGANETVPVGGDVITAVDGQPVKTVAELAERLAGRKPGDTVVVTIVRDGGEQQVTVGLQAWPEAGS